MEIDLTDKIVVVTGGSSGIGLATARAVAEHGGQPVLIGRRADALAEAAASFDRPPLTIAADVGDQPSVSGAFDEIARQFGRVDALLNIAGAVAFRQLENMDVDAIEHIVRTNYLGPVWTLKAALPLLRAAGHSDVVNVSSEATLHSPPWASIYVSSKAALEAFSSTMMEELRPDRIRVSCLIVGTTATNMPQTMPIEDLRAVRPVLESSGYYRHIGKPMDPRWVAETLVFAISRPPGMALDVFHARSADPVDS